MRPATRAGLSLVAPAALLPSVAWACPACARDAIPHLTAIVGSLLLVPFALGAWVAWVVWRGDAEEDR